MCECERVKRLHTKEPHIIDWSQKFGLEREKRGSADSIGFNQRTKIMPLKRWHTAFSSGIVLLLLPAIPSAVHQQFVKILQAGSDKNKQDPLRRCGVLL